MPTPTPRPERRRNLRRSIVGIAREMPRARLSTSVPEGGVAAPPPPADLRVNNMVLPPVGRNWNSSDSGAAVVPLHVLGEAVAGGGIGGGFRVRDLRVGDG